MSMERSELSTAAASACGRLDDFVRLDGPQMGRWILDLALGLAERGRRRRTPGAAPRRGPDGRKGAGR